MIKCLLLIIPFVQFKISKRYQPARDKVDEKKRKAAAQ